MHKLPQNSWPLTLSLSLLCALLILASLPGSLFGPLILFAFFPLFILKDRTTRLQYTLAWTLAGLAFWLGTTYWLFYYLRAVFEYRILLSASMTLLAVIIPTTAFTLTGFFRLHPVFHAILVTLIFAVFPSNPAIALYQYPILIQHADIAGLSLVYLTVLLFNYYLPKPKILIPLTALILCYGAFRIHQVDTIQDSVPLHEFTQIGFVQPNIPGADLSPYFGEYTDTSGSFQSAMILSYKLVKQYPSLDLILWPETPGDFPIYEFDWVRAAYIDLLNQSNKNTPLLLVSTYPWVDPSTATILTGQNSTYLITKDGEISHPYAKANLIPFSEYLPFEQKFPSLRKLFPRTGQITKGTITPPITLENNTAAAALICYDPLFPRFVRDVCLNGAQILLSLDNNTNFGPTNASHGHLATSLFRAIENRTPMIRLSNNGISCSIDPAGRIDEDSLTNLYEATFRATNILPAKPGKKSPFHYIYP